MKKVTLCLIASIFLSVLSCSDDDSSPDLINVESDASEEVSLDPVDVSENIFIDGTACWNTDNLDARLLTPTGMVRE